MATSSHPKFRLKFKYKSLDFTPKPSSMATQIQPIFDHSRKRQRLTQFPKLPPNEQVEVRSIEEGFQGSWHSGIVIESRTRIRVVKYDHIVCDDSSNNLIESVRVSFPADCKIPADWGSRSESPTYRGKIRPIPPRLIHKELALRKGQCVDVFYKDAWWEGVVFGRFDDGLGERVFLVFFPDMGDELRVPFGSLRRTQDWDAVNDEWELRKDWVFLEVIEELKWEWPVLVSVKQIWYDVRMTRRFVNEMKEWTFPVKERWKETVKEVVVESLKLTMAEFFQRLNFSEDFHDGCSFSDVKRRVLDSVMNLEPSFFENLCSDLVVKSDHENLENLHTDLVVKSDHENLENPVFEWLDVFPGSKCCPDSISKYFELSKYGGKHPAELTLKVRQHLSYLGWKIESKVYRIGLNGGATSRYRYTDPNGKQYYSLNILCTELNKRYNSSSSFDVNGYLETPLSSAPAKEEQEPQTHMIESEFCPQAVVDYCSMTSGWNSDLPKSRDGWVKELQTSAMKHLFAVGWSKFYSERVSGRKVIVYASPNGRKFYSLRGACNHYIKEWLCSGLDNICELAETREINVCRDLIKKKGTTLRIKPLSSSKKESVKKFESLTESRNGSTRDSLRNTRVLRSSKRVRKEISPRCRTPRTVLSWLIDNNIVLPRAKVQYRCKKDGRTMREGRVTRDGIKCRCCRCTFSITGFQSHAGRRTAGRPSANVFLEDGRSLLDCQRQLQENLDQHSRLIMMKPRGIEGNLHEVENDNDYICSICQYGGELVLCDECPSSFHTSCLGLKEVPEGKWFCPSCCCGICNRNRFNENCEQNTDGDILNCAQCERRYHFGCLKGGEGFLNPETYLEENWFCSLRCEEIFAGLQRLLGKQIPVGRDNLTWTLLKYNKFESSDYDPSDTDELTENYSKLNVAISVMHECFEPVKEPRTGRDITEDVILCRWSELRRLNFKGFYTVLLEKDDELISTAVVRVYGEKVAELPLVGTRFQYRRRGMCHILMHELEKKLTELGVERLVLPAVSSVLHTWTRSFGFSLMTESEKSKFLRCTFLDFQGTTMCHKLLATDLPSTEPGVSRGDSCDTIVDLDRIGAVSEVSQEGRIHENSCDTIVDLDRIGTVSEVSQEERIHESGEVEKSPLEHNDITNPLGILMNQPNNIEQQSEAECSFEASNREEGNNNRFLKCYHRRKYMPTRVEAFFH